MIDQSPIFEEKKVIHPHIYIYIHSPLVSIYLPPLLSKPKSINLTSASQNSKLGITQHST